MPVNPGSLDATNHPAKHIKYLLTANTLPILYPPV